MLAIGLPGCKYPATICTKVSILKLSQLVTMVEMGDSRIDMPTPVMAPNAPRKRMDMTPSNTDMTKLHHGKVESLL